MYFLMNFLINLLRKYNIVWFCFLGIGIDDMFILLFGMVGVFFFYKLIVEEWMVFMLKKGGVVIIIMLVIDMIVFIIGVFVVFVRIKIFCIYIGI